MGFPLLTRTFTDRRDGRHRWGDHAVIVGRYGVVVRTLTIYPPGSTTAERRWLRAWRSAPMFAVVLFWLGLAGFSAGLPLPVACAATAAMVAIVLGLLAWRSRRTRRAVVSIMSETPPGMSRPEILDRQATMNRVIATMRAAERHLAAGEIDQVQFLRCWFDAYETVRRAAGVVRRPRSGESETPRAPLTFQGNHGGFQWR